MIRALDLEGSVLAVIGQLTIPPSLMTQVLEDTERYLASLNQPVVKTTDRATIEGKLRRLARLYADGMVDDGAYERERDVLRAQLDTATTTAMLRFDAEQAAANLAHLPNLLARATAAERRAVVRSIFDRIWVRDRVLNGLTARAEVYPLLRAVSRVVYGVADGTRTHNNRNHNPALCH